VSQTHPVVSSPPEYVFTPKARAESPIYLNKVCMPFATVILPPIIACWIGLILTGRIKIFAEKRSLLDHPNRRSSHSSPVPRGGGLAIVITVFGYLIVAGILGQLDWNIVIGMGGGGLAVAGVGWADDIRSLSASVRLVVHFAAATWAVQWIGGFPSLNTGEAVVRMGFGGSVLAVIGLVWAINLFNFMDGIDGIAAIETISIGMLGGVLFLLRGDSQWAPLSFVLAAAALGFLKWNWSPARIFLGDVGSGFLGFMIGAIAISSERSGSVPFLVWAILFAAFIVDATVTLFRRIPRGDWRHAHRSHAYQRAVQSGLSHARVSLGFAGFNLFLGLLAVMAVRHPGLTVALLLAAVASGLAMYLLIERMEPFNADDVTQ
jgi:Fuc2NAc and GlcNAc transferase